MLNIYDVPPIFYSLPNSRSSVARLRRGYYRIQQSSAELSSLEFRYNGGHDAGSGASRHQGEPQAFIKFSKLGYSVGTY